MTALAFSLNSNYLAAADADGHIYIWDVGTRRMVENLTDPSSRGVNAVAFTPDGNFVAAGDANGNTYIFNVSSSGA